MPCPTEGFLQGETLTVPDVFSRVKHSSNILLFPDSVCIFLIRSTKKYSPPPSTPPERFNSIPTRASSARRLTGLSPMNRPIAPGSTASSKSCSAQSPAALRLLIHTACRMRSTPAWVHLEPRVGPATTTRWVHPGP